MLSYRLAPITYPESVLAQDNALDPWGIALLLKMKWRVGNCGNVGQLQQPIALLRTLPIALAKLSNIQNVLSGHTPDAMPSCAVARRIPYTTNSGVMSVELFTTLDS